MGLTDEEVLKSRIENGSNELVVENKNTFLRLFLDSLSDPIIKILLLALTIKVIFLFKESNYFETIGILVAVLLATMISSISEYGSERAFKKLQQDTNNILVKVYRNNKLVMININEVVKNDIISLITGDIVPADGYLIFGTLSVDESMLNGETKEAYKKSKKSNVIMPENKVFRGTTIYNGNANIKVTGVGTYTTYGKISEELSAKNEDSPLKIRLKELAKGISKMGYIGALLASFSHLFINIVINNNFNVSLILNNLSNFNLMADLLIYSLTLGVTIIVVSVPEGLPMMITLVLSSNMRKMLKDNVLVRKMVGIETAGNLNLLLTDKTGTLTKGKLLVTEFIDICGNEYKKISELNNYLNYKKLLYYSLYCNNESKISNNEIIGGNSTDKALLSFVKDEYYECNILNKTPFSSEKKISEIVINNGDEITLVKGAPEVILNSCNYSLDKTWKLENINLFKIKKDLNKLTNTGKRVIALKIILKDKHIYLGLVGIKDELRKEAKKSIINLHNAGINVIMVTGDNKDTAKVIAKESGILNISNYLVLTSEEFNRLSDEDIIKDLNKIRVIARSMPQDKSRLVRLAKEKNLVVGMTGDGVNDAPALKKADVGFAMGSGTEVSKEASDIVILDDNILSITKAVLYGRTIFKSIRKFIIYQLSVNVCALIISVVGSLIGISEPITIIQMLWLNMIMDTFAGLAFAFEPPLDEYMDEIPKKKSEPIMNKYMLSQIITSGVYTSLLCLLFLKLDFVKNFFRTGENNIYLYTAYFALFIFLGIFNAFNTRTTRINILANMFRNKVFLIVFSFIMIVQLIIIYYGDNLFRTFGLLPNELLIVLMLSMTIIPIDFIRKVFLKQNGIKSGV